MAGSPRCTTLAPVFVSVSRGSPASKWTCSHRSFWISDSWHPVSIRRRTAAMAEGVSERSCSISRGAAVDLSDGIHRERSIEPGFQHSRVDGRLPVAPGTLHHNTLKRLHARHPGRSPRRPQSSARVRSPDRCFMRGVRAVGRLHQNAALPGKHPVLCRLVWRSSFSRTPPAGGG